MRKMEDMAQEAGMTGLKAGGLFDNFLLFEQLVRADERKQIALDKKAENARELGLDYEPVENETVTAEQHDKNLRAKYRQDMKSRNWISFNDWLLEATPPAAQRQWVGLTDEEKNAITWGKTVYEILELAEAKLKEKNT